jgi:DNA-binding NtrC family response regulator
VDWLPSGAGASSQQAPPLLPRGTLAERRADFDRRVLQEVLTRCRGDTRRAADELAITRRSVYNLAQRLGIDLHPPEVDG